jgi:excisionase family DNA binding protein
VPDEFLTVAEIAELLKVNAQTVRNWVDRGELPAVRVGSRRVRVRRSALDVFIAAGSTAADGAADESGLRDALATELDATRVTLKRGDDAELTAALRSLAGAASRLARALERSPS